MKIFKPSIRLLATDIDGTLLNPQFQISEGDLVALRRAHAAGVEIVLVTGRRHSFAMPIARQLGFDLWLISSNGAVTRSMAGETFHRDMMPAESCRTYPARSSNWWLGTSASAGFSRRVGMNNLLQSIDL